MKTIYILGSPLYEKDSLPVKLLPRLQSSFPDIHFQHLDPTENLPEQKHLILIDTIINTKEVKILNEKDIDKIESSPRTSLHDFDLGFQLKLMKKLGKIKEVTIIGIPPEKKQKEMLEKIRSILNNITNDLPQ